MLIACNWKQYLSPAEEITLFKHIIEANLPQPIVVFPSTLSLVALRPLANQNVALGVQDFAPIDEPVVTGSVRISNIEEEWLMIAHSEERKLFHETFADFQKKLLLALDHDKKVILCVGEPEKLPLERVLTLVRDELTKFEDCIKGRFAQVVIAYEPWWAVASDLYPTQEQIQAVMDMIHSLGFSQVLYGGSVSAENLAQISVPGLGGFLIGRASTTIDNLKSILSLI
ncbi:MAG: triosephosphate isomerase [Candidatus Abawacabacteria bacterium]|nr:triosephosphate isomerase [Candidatus Abawacabacteria bacterium]